MLIIDYLFAILIFAIIYLTERLIAFWRKKKPIWPFFDNDFLLSFLAYFTLSLIWLALLFVIFPKTKSFNLLWVDVCIYLIVRLFNPNEIYELASHKEKISLKKKRYFLGLSLFIILLIESFAFNYQAYSDNKSTFKYESFISESIKSGGEINSDKIVLKSKQSIVIKTSGQDYENLYLHFDNDDMNLYVNIKYKKLDSNEYVWYNSFLIDPAFDAYGYFPLRGMDSIEYLLIEFDIDDTRYLNNDAKPLIVIDKIEFDSYFPLIINPLRIGLLFGLLLIGANFKKLFIPKELSEEKDNFKKLEKIVLLAGAAIFVLFFITALINHEMYFIKYDELYLGGTSSNNIYYQQFDAYLKGQLHLDVEVDPKLLAAENPYGNMPSGVTYLWDHAFYNGKYYCYYGHAPIYLVMMPIYLLSGYVPSNLYILQFGVLFSVFAFVLAALQLIKVFIKKCTTPFVVLAIISAVFGSLLFTNNTYEYGGMIYRIPYAYASGFLFLCIYLFIKGYLDEKHRFIYFIFFGLSLVFIVLSRPIQMLYLALLIPFIVKMIKESITNKTQKRMLLDYLPMVGIVLIGAVFVMVMNKVRFDSILEFGEHYQLTVNDCRTNTLSIDGILPTIYHYFIQPPAYRDGMLTYSYQKYLFEHHPYVTDSIGIFFMPITLLMFIIPFVFTKEDDIKFRIFIYLAPALIFFIAFYVCCFAGVCPRYIGDIAPFAALTGALIGLKAIERDNGNHKVVPILIAVVFFVNIVLSGQYHFVGFDGLRIGDFFGLLGHIKTIGNHYK